MKDRSTIDQQLFNKSQFELGLQEFFIESRLCVFCGSKPIEMALSIKR
jgi:hypothetical protein